MCWKPPGAPNRAKLALLFAVLGLVAALPYRLQFHDGINDEGVVLQAAWRIASGQIPYKDFDLFYTPGSMLFTAAWFKLFGATIESARWLMSIVGGTLGALIFLISSKLLRPWLCFVPPVLFALSGYSEWPVVSYHWFSITCLLAALVCLLEWYDRRDGRWMIASGVAAGMAGACLQSEGVSSVLAVMLALALSCTRDSWKARALDALRFLGGILLVWLPLLLYLVAHGAVHAFVEDTILRVLSGLYVSHGAPYDLSKHVVAPWSHFLSQWPDSWNAPRFFWALESATLASTWTLKYALLFPVIAGTVALAFKRRSHWIAAALFLVFWLLVARERLDLLYSNYLMPLWYVGLLGLLEFLGERAPRLKAVLMALLVGLYSLNAWVTWRYTQSFVYPVQTPRGTLWARSLPLAQSYQGLCATAFKLTPPGSKTFAWPYAAAFYFLAAVDNPSRLDFLVPGWQEDGQTDVVLQALLDNKVEYIYRCPLGEDVLKDYPNVDPKFFEEGIEHQLEVFGRAYEMVGRVGGYEIYRRRAKNP